MQWLLPYPDYIAQLVEQITLSTNAFIMDN
jgi:hypothetical protein